MTITEALQVVPCTRCGESYVTRGEAGLCGHCRALMRQIRLVDDPAVAERRAVLKGAVRAPEGLK